MTRRQTLRAAAAAGGVLLAGVAAGAVAEAGPRRAAAGRIVLQFLPSQSWSSMNTTIWGLLHDGMRPFLEEHPGVEVNLWGYTYQGSTQAAMLAGTGPDVFSDWIMPPFVQNGLMLDLAPYIKRDNIDLGVFMQGEMQFFREAALFSPTNPNGLYAIPAYFTPKLTPSISVSWTSWVSSTRSRTGPSRSGPGSGRPAPSSPGRTRSSVTAPTTRSVATTMATASSSHTGCGASTAAT